MIIKQTKYVLEAFAKATNLNKTGSEREEKTYSDKEHDENVVREKAVSFLDHCEK